MECLSAWPSFILPLNPSALVLIQIYDLESTYLDETKDLGNIFTGWENYTSKDKVKVRKSIANEERLFSLSSVTSPASRREDAKQQKLLGGTPGAGKPRGKPGAKAAVGATAVAAVAAAGGGGGAPEPDALPNTL